jgi:hypothetical protein
VVNDQETGSQEKDPELYTMPIPEETANPEVEAKVETR